MRICVLQYEDLVFQSVERALRKLGHEVLAIQTVEQALSADEILEAIKQFSPDWILFSNLDLFIWHPEGEKLEAALSSGKIPLVSWHYESPQAAGGFKMMLRWVYKMPSKEILFLTSDTGFLPFFRDHGFQAEYLPLAVDEELLKRPLILKRQTEMRSAVSYSGTNLIESSPGQVITEFQDLIPVFVSNVEQVYWSYYEPHVKTDTREELSNYKDLVRRLLTQFFRVQHESLESYEAAKKSFLAELPSTLSADLREATQLLLMPVIDRIYSLSILTFLLNKLSVLNIRVYGGLGWKPLLIEHKDQTARLNREELLEVYQSSSVIFCHTKYWFKNFVHDRVFEILAVGGFPLIDYRKDLDLLFSKDEMRSYRSLDEAKDLICYYSTHETERKTLIEKGRARVEREHTYFHRTQKMLEFVSKHFEPKGN